MLITAAVGSALEFVFIRRLKNPGVLQMIIVTIGLSILIREVALHIWDEQVRALRFFTGNEISTVGIFGARISPQVLWVLGVTALIVTGLFLFFRFTLTGKAMRACSVNRRAASARVFGEVCVVSTRDGWSTSPSCSAQQSVP